MFMDTVNEKNREQFEFLNLVIKEIIDMEELNNE